MNKQVLRILEIYGQIRIKILQEKGSEDGSR